MKSCAEWGVMKTQFMAAEEDDPAGRRPIRRRVLTIVVCGTIIVIALLYLVLPIAIGGYASLRFPAAVGDPPAGFQEVSLTTTDGVDLKGWYAPPTNGTAILLLHGSTGSREDLRPYARMLADDGFGVLAIDLRGHGESGGDGNAFDWNGTRDVEAGIAFLRGQNVSRIEGLGLSLGGEVLLGAASTLPDLRALVSDGATHRSVDDYLILPSRQNLLQSWTTRLMYASTGVFTGDTPPITILDSITAAERTRLLLIAAGGKEQEIEYNTRFFEAVGDRASLWVVPGVGHTGAFANQPAAYTRRVTGFFWSALAPGAG